MCIVCWMSQRLLNVINCLGAQFCTNDFNWISISPERFLSSILFCYGSCIFKSTKKIVAKNWFRMFKKKKTPFQQQLKLKSPYYFSHYSKPVPCLLKFELLLRLPNIFFASTQKCGVVRKYFLWQRILFATTQNYSFWPLLFDTLKHALTRTSYLLQSLGNNVLLSPHISTWRCQIAIWVAKHLSPNPCITFCI